VILLFRAALSMGSPTLGPRQIFHARLDPLERYSPGLGIRIDRDDPETTRQAGMKMFHEVVQRVTAERETAVATQPIMGSE